MAQSYDLAKSRAEAEIANLEVDAAAMADSALGAYGVTCAQRIHAVYVAVYEGPEAAERWMAGRDKEERES